MFQLWTNLPLEGSRTSLLPASKEKSNCLAVCSSTDQPEGDGLGSLASPPIAVADEATGRAWGDLLPSTPSRSRRGLPCIVMQFVAGVSLKEHLKRRSPLPLEEILRIGIQTAQGLAATHAQGFVHRDIKPANILLEGGTGLVKITDFGRGKEGDGGTAAQTGPPPRAWGIHVPNSFRSTFWRAIEQIIVA